MIVMPISPIALALRPDAAVAIEQPGVKRALPRYRKVLLNKTKAKFQIAKEKNLLSQKVRTAYNIMKKCELCERSCGANRAAGALGHCRVGNKPVISSAFEHMGEEPFLVPSFTVFFMGCSFHCQYCQNWSISQWYERGTITSIEELAKLIDKHGNCRNVNFVGGEPTPQLPFILDTLQHVKANIPTIWNSNFYMSLRAMRLLHDIIDVYLSDWKYGNDRCAERLSLVKNYWKITKRNHDMAFKDSEMVIRHLILPNHFECCTKPILEYIAKAYGKKVIVNVMGQYRPEWKAHQYPDIARRPTADELGMAWKLASDLDLNWIR
jgi:putative pyruvate formate lyase activating enzyme